MSTRPDTSATVHSHADRRQSPRHVTLLRAGILHVRGSSELCLVRNISSDGLMARVYEPIPEGQELQVELKCGQMIAGTVAWEKDQTIGIRFSHPIDLETVLAGRWVSETGIRSRQPRLKVNCPATLRSGARIHRGRLSDISAAGAKILLEKELTEEDAVTLVLVGLPPIAGTIRWVSGTAVGMSFNELLSLDDLARWRQTQSAVLEVITKR